MSTVPSVDALSITITSRLGYFCSSTDSRQRRINRPLLKVTIVTATKSLEAMKFLGIRSVIEAVPLVRKKAPACYVNDPEVRNERSEASVPNHPGKHPRNGSEQHRRANAPVPQGAKVFGCIS